MVCSFLCSSSAFMAPSLLLKHIPLSAWYSFLISYYLAEDDDQPYWFYRFKSWLSSELHNLVKKFPKLRNSYPRKRQFTEEFKFVLGIYSLGYPGIYQVTHFFRGLEMLKNLVRKSGINLFIKKIIPNIMIKIWPQRAPRFTLLDISEILPVKMD